MDSSLFINIQHQLETILNYLDKQPLSYKKIKQKSKFIEEKLIILLDKIPYDDEKNMEKYKKIDKLFQKIKAYIHQQETIITNKHLKIITFINLSLLPISIITGFYGMNFKSLGSPSLKSGHFAKKKGHYLVYLLIFVSFLITSSIYIRLIY